MPVICGALNTDYGANILLNDMVKYFSCPGMVTTVYRGKSENQRGSIRIL